MSHVFEPFFTTKEVGEGSGLGLSIVKGIITRHGGTIDVTSEKATGTCFSVFLPTARAMTFEPTPRSSEPHLLLVDDDDMVLRVLEDLLKTRGFAVTAFNDPQSALAHLAGAVGQIDVMITDNNMPKMKGVELAKSARAISPKLPIILITGFARPSEADLSNVSRDLMKPVFDQRPDRRHQSGHHRASGCLAVRSACVRPPAAHGACLAAGRSAQA